MLPDQDRIQVRGTDLEIHFPADAYVHSTTAYVALHEPSDWWDYPTLTGQVVAVTKWSERELVLEGTTFHLVDERDILAVIGDIEPL